VVATSLNAGLKRWWPVLAGAAALLFIVAMVLTGSQPESQQLIKFEAKGVMQMAPEKVTAVDIEFKGNTYKLARTGPRDWIRPGGAALEAKLGADASMAVQFMNTSGPAREMTPDEIPGADMKGFGLAPPRLSVTLYAGPAQVLTAHFGANNPGGLLQYMRVDGRSEVFLMSRFVGQQWEQLASRLAAP
jgi:hypothetical protein